MNKLARQALALAREAVRLERTTVPGIVNIVGLFFVLVLLLGQGVADLFQALVRLGNSDYTTGLPSFIVVLLVYALMLLGCVAILAAADVRSPRGRDDGRPPVP